MGKRFEKGGLVLSRKPDEFFVINYGGVLTTVTVSAVRGSVVKLHINAPESVLISRSELIKKVEVQCGEA